MSLLKGLIRASEAQTNKEKVEILATMGFVSPSLKRYLKLVLDPQHVFNMTLKNLPEPRFNLKLSPQPLPNNNTGWYLADLLDALSEGLRGNAAQKAVASFLNVATPEERALFKYAIDRQLPGKIGRTIVNKAFPGLLYKQPYGGVTSYDPDKIYTRFDWDHGVLLEEKADGLSLFLSKYTDPDLVGTAYAVHTRQGQDVTHALRKPFADVFSSMQINTVLHVEGMLRDLDTGDLLPRVEANGRYTSVIKGEGYHNPGEYHLVVLDIIDYKSFHSKIDTTPLVKRFARRSDFLTRYYEASLDNAGKELAYNSPSVAAPDWHILYSVAAARGIVQTWISKGGEGGVLKDLDAPWKDTENMISQMKMKNEFECTLEVVDWKPHSKHPEWVGSLLCQSAHSENGPMIKTLVGSGLNEEAGHLLNRTLGGIEFLGKRIEVKAECISKHNALQIPRITEVRLDKEFPDTYAEVLGAYNDSIALKEG